MNTRQLQLADVEQARDLVRRFHGLEISESHAARLLANPVNVILVAETGGESVGFLFAHRLDRLELEARALFLYEIEVAQSHRRRGAGRALVEHALRLARDEDMAEAYVFTNHSNSSAAAFYRATGGQIEDGDELMFVYPLVTPNKTPTSS